MARTDIEKLVVQLSGDVRNFEKSMQRAQARANTAATGIESRFRKMNSTVNKGFAGLGKGFGGGILAGGIAGLVSQQGLSQLRDVVKSVADLGDEAERAGVSAEALQSLSFIGRQNGVEADKLVDALKKLNLEVGKAQTKGNDLKKIFDANNLKFSADPSENFRKVAELIRNAKTEQDKAIIGAAAFGKAYGDLIPLLNLGADAIRKGEQAARDTGTVISNELVAKAQEFDDKWTAVWDTWTAKGKGAVISILAEMQDLISLGDDLIRKLGITSENLRGGGLIPGLNQQHIKELESLFPALADQRAEAARIEEELLGLAKKRADLEAQIASLKALQIDGDRGGEIQEFQDRLDLTIAKVEELRKKLAALRIELPSGIIGGGAAGVSPLPSGAVGPGAAAPTVIPSKLDESADKLSGAAGKLESVIDEFARDVVVSESGGRADAKNPLSSATGLGQFIESTWIDLFRRHFPDKAKGVSDAAILALRKNGQVSFDLIKAYARENAAVLQKAGVSVSEAALQLSHFLGPGGAIKVLQAAPGTPIQGLLDQQQINANQSILGGGATVDDVIRYAEARTRATEADKAGKSAFDELLTSQREGRGEMQLENDLFGQTTLAAEQARIEYQLLAEAKRALGRELFPNEIAEIKASAAATAQLKFRYDELGRSQELAAQKAQQLADAQRRTAEQSLEMARAFEGAFAGALQGFVSDLVHGKSVTEALTNALQNLADQLLQIVLNQLFTGMFSGAMGGGAGGGLLAGLFHKGARAAGAGGQRRRVAPAAFLAAQRYHQGGLAGFRPGEIPAILKRGEPIGPAAVDAAARRMLAIGGARLGGGAGTGTAPQVNLTTKVVNRFDSGSFLSEALGTPAGEKAILNFVKARPAAFRGAIA